MFPRGARPPPVASRPVPPARPSGEKILIKIIILVNVTVNLMVNLTVNVTVNLTVNFDQMLIKFN